MITFTNTITITIAISVAIAISIANAIISSSPRQNARTHAPTIDEKRAAESAGHCALEIGSPEVRIFYFPCGMSGYNCRHYDHEESGDHVTVCTLNIWLRLWSQPMSWFWLPYTARHLPHSTCHMLPAKLCPPNATWRTPLSGWHL